MKRVLLILMLSGLGLSMSLSAHAKDLSFNFKKKDVIEVIETYSKATGQKFVVSPRVNGKVSIFNKDKISTEVAFNQLSQALALQSISIVQVEDTYNVMPAREAQRDNIQVVHALPPMEPVRMVTWVITLKHANADDINKSLRVIPSKDGEMVPVPKSNQLVLTDWTTNLNRVSQVIEKVDVPSKRK